MFCVNDVLIDDTYAEAFSMTAARLLITAESRQWAEIAGQVVTGYAVSVIGCDCEAGVDAVLEPPDTPDGRPGVSVLLFSFNRQKLREAVVNRVGQCVLTCPTTACYNGLALEEDRTIRVGGRLRFFGDGHQSSKYLEGRRYWRIPVMDGEFLCEDVFGTQKAVGGGNFLILGENQETALHAAEAAVQAIRPMPGVILPFPGGIVRSGSKVGSRYRGLRASTNNAYCPTLRGLGTSALPEDVNGVYEIVIDGLNLNAVREAMRRGIRAACGPGVVRIGAGNYGGRLGAFQIRLHEVLQS